MAPRKKKSSEYVFPHPMDCESLVGHSDTLRTFMDAWDNRDKHPIHPVWMLTGPRGIGKSTLAYKIAKMVYGNVGDFFIVDKDRNLDKNGNLKPDGKVISVYTVRAMIDKMQMSSMSDGWRVILIDSVDELSTGASNAILKLLEEPPAQTLFLLVVHQLSNVLPTVRSRARVEKMRPLTISQMRDLCVRYMPEDDISTDMLRLANGCFGKIANLKSSGGDEIYEHLIATLNNPRSNAGDIMAIAKKIAPTPEIHQIVLDAIAHFGLADLYPMATHAIADIERIHLEPEIAIFKIISEIKKCL